MRSYAALPISLLAALTFALDRVRALRRHPFAWALVEAGGTGVAVALTGAGSSPLLPYLLVPPVCLALTGTRVQVAQVSLASLGGVAVGRGIAQYWAAVDGAPLDELVVQTGQWVLLGLALGLVASFAQHLTADAPVSAAARYEEAQSLLGQLRAVTRRLPGGLDVGSSAEAMLEHCASVVPSQRSAVLVQPGTGALVPVAVRGTRRVPWRAPLSEPGPLQQAWEGGRPVVDRRAPDVHGRRRGSTLAVLPLSTGPRPFGLLILETFDEHGFDEQAVLTLEECAVAGALRLETALLFDEVRSSVTVEERDRLAREMHDGVAQELAFVGYQLDALRHQAAKVDDALAVSLGDVRKGLTGLISDIRLSITDLKTSVSSDRGLGAAVSSYVRAAGSGQALVVHLSLQEAPFRLPGEQEVVLFHIVQAVAQDVRRSGRAGNLWVTLEVDPPSARLRVEHDGPVDDLASVDLTEYAEHLSRFGGSLHTEARPGSGLRVDAVLKGGDGGDQRAARGRPRPDQAGPETGVGGDGRPGGGG